MPRVIIPPPLRVYTDNQRKIIIDGYTLEETMVHLSERHPDLHTIINDSSLLSIFINGKAIRSGIEKWGTLPLSVDDEITLIIPIAGG
jgi:hypothetical protein